MQKSSDSSVRRAVPLPSGLKEALRNFPPIADAWTVLRSAQVVNEYRRRRERYASTAAERGIRYVEAEVIAQARARIAARGYTPEKRNPGSVHTFACIPAFGWHEQLLPDLKLLGPVTRFDYTALGYGVAELAAADKNGVGRREEMLTHILPALRAAHAENPVDWIFCYGGGQDTSPALINQITQEFGIPVVNMSLDDKQGWAGRRTSECRTGAADITAAFDLFVTSARVACEWHIIEGGRPLYAPEGVDTNAFRPMSLPQDIPMSFVGNAYGFRRSVIDHLDAASIPVQTFGGGWPNGRWADDIVSIFNRSQINLGMGGIEYAEHLTNVKGRDFEVAGTGGGVYLTSFNADLAQHFVIGSEILCYSSRDEMVDLARYYLAHAEEGQEIAARARARCVREHRWLHRYEQVLRALEILPPSPQA